MAISGAAMATTPMWATMWAAKEPRHASSSGPTQISASRTRPSRQRQAPHRRHSVDEEQRQRHVRCTATKLSPESSSVAKPWNSMRSRRGRVVMRRVVRAEAPLPPGEHAGQRRSWRARAQWSLHRNAQPGRNRRRGSPRLAQKIAAPDIAGEKMQRPDHRRGEQRPERFDFFGNDAHRRITAPPGRGR